MEPMLSERRWYYWAWLLLICGFAGFMRCT